MTEQQPATKTPDIRKIPYVWPQRLRVILEIFTIVILLSAIIITFKYDLIAKQISFARNLVVQAVGKQGFTLNDIYISGHHRTKLSEINQILQIKRGDNFFDLQPQQIKQQLETLPWIRDVTVKRSFLPNILQIHIQEKQVLALWQLKHRLYPLDRDGYVIEAEYRPDKPVLLVIGQDAPEHLIDLLQTIAKIDNNYSSRLKVANYISQRRWNLTFDDINSGVTVKMPEDNLEAALTRLINLDKKSSILKRKLTIIDLRLADKMVVKMRKKSDK